MSLARALARNTTAQALDAVLTAAMSLIVIGMLARYLGPTRFGQYASILAIVPLFLLVGEWGMEQVVLRDISRHRTNPGILIGTTIVCKCIFAIPAVGLCWLAFWLLGYPEDTTVGGRIYSLFLFVK